MKAKRRSTTKKKATRNPRMSVVIRVRVWWNARDGRIRIVSPGNFISTVSEKRGLRYHPHLFSKLRSLLKKRGKWFEIA